VLGNSDQSPYDLPTPAVTMDGNSFFKPNHTISFNLTYSSSSSPKKAVIMKDTTEIITCSDNERSQISNIDSRIRCIRRAKTVMIVMGKSSDSGCYWPRVNGATGIMVTVSDEGSRNQTSKTCKPPKLAVPTTTSTTTGTTTGTTTVLRLPTFTAMTTDTAILAGNNNTNNSECAIGAGSHPSAPDTRLVLLFVCVAFLFKAEYMQ
jgi:hypothetical protein